jgi:predicted phosphodiesterase
VRLAVLSDVHGNRLALEAVVTDARDRGVDGWWVLGDLVAIGPEPVATLELLTNLEGLVVTRGNTERYVLTRDRPPPHASDVAADPELLDVFAAVESSFSWTRGALAAHGWLRWLADLPLEVRIDLPDGARLLGVHASPGRDDGPGITPRRPDAELQADLAGAAADVVVAGHTHLPTDRFVGGTRAVNAGSVSNPITEDPRASYVVLHGDRHGHGLEHRRVVYDVEAFLRRVDTSGHPQGDFIASFHRGERGRHPSTGPGIPVVAP